MATLSVKPEITTENDVYECDPDLHLRLGELQNEKFAAAFKALSNPVRLQMIDLISQGSGQVCGCDIERHFDLTQPTISHHLKVLRDAGLITSEARGVWVHHYVNVTMVNSLRDLLAMIHT